MSLTLSEMRERNARVGLSSWHGGLAFNWEYSIFIELDYDPETGFVSVFIGEGDPNNKPAAAIVHVTAKSCLSEAQEIFYLMLKAPDGQRVRSVQDHCRTVEGVS